MKKVNIQKVGRSLIIAMSMMAATPMLTSCEDWFNIKPESELVGEDFWQKKSDVESAVAACYRALEEPGAMERLIVWSEVRSDNVIAGTNCSNDISYILNANLDANNGYASWGPIYTVINYCNNVLENAPLVQQRDPAFTSGELRSYEAEAKTLRALCYFYLVRTFKDVPYSTQSFSDDTRAFQLPQTNGDAVIDSVLTDLENISNNHAKSVYSTTADTKGRITQKALWTLMADMYLWRNNYDKCIEMCDKVLNTSTNPLTLETAKDYNRNVFGIGNSTESIFELQFDTYTPDYVVNEMYGYEGGRSSVNNLSSFDFSKMSLFYESTDLRYKNSYFGGSGSNAILPIKKYVAYRKESNLNTVSESDYVQNENTQNWIFYRLSDIYLMKAEALTERNQGSDLADALELVNRTFMRANPSRDSSPYTATNYGSQDAMRQLVFDERQREFLYEGKRYYDLIRRIRRENNLQAMVSKYLMPKYANMDEATVTAKLASLNALYMPISKNELKVNKLLKQNPFYNTSTDIAKQ